MGVTHISVSNFGSITLWKMQPAGRVELEYKLDNEAGLDLLQGAVNAIPRLRRKPVISQGKPNEVGRIILQVRIKNLKRNASPTKHLERVVNDFLKGVERAATQPEMQTFLDRKPNYSYVYTHARYRN